MDISTKKYLSKIINVVLVFAIIISLIGFCIDLKYTLTHGGIDLRNRVVGARLLTRGLDPYYFRWRPGNDVRLLDPMDQLQLPVSRVTVPPSVLVLHSLIANFPYFVQKIIWFILQWAAFLLSLLFLLINHKKPWINKFILIITLLLISGNSFWRLHVDYGQIYVVYVVLISLSYWICQKDFKGNNILGGGVIGFAASLRFPIIIMVLPMILFKKFKLFAATVASFGLFTFIFVAITGLQVWANFFSAMRVIGKLTVGLIKTSNSDVSIVLPSTIEGLNYLRNFLSVCPTSTRSIPLVLEKLNIKLESNQLIVILGILLLTYSGLILWRIKKQRNQSQIQDVDQIFLIGTIMILIIEWFIPAPRTPYSDIQLLIPLVLVLKNLNYSNDKSIILVSLLVTGLLLTNGTFPWFPQSVLTGQFILMGTLIFGRTTNHNDLK
jgi:hypothetical protein